MKRILTLIFLSGVLCTYAQDTTSWRAVSKGYEGQFNWFEDDMTFYNSTPCTGMGYPMGIFMNPQDSLLYCVGRPATTSGPNRDIYLLDPFAGTATLYDALTTTHISTADISADGQTVYMMVGNGSTGSPGDVIAYDWSTGSETSIGNIPTTNGISRGLEFHPPDSSLYIFEENYSVSLPQLHRYDLATDTYTSDPITGLVGNAVKGAMWTGNTGEFLIDEGWSNNKLITDGTSESLTMYDNVPFPNYFPDTEVIWTIRRPMDTLVICSNNPDSMLISLIYSSATFEWYQDGVALTETNDSMWVSTAGTYRALYNILPGFYMWSEPIVVEEYTAPIVTVTQTENDSMLCGVGDFITLTGVSGSTMQWYQDGVIIAGATSDTYDAATPGVYNQMVTDANGCADSAAIGYTVIIDPDCGVGLIELGLNAKIYPNPVEDQLFISTELDADVTILNLLGEVIYEGQVKAGNENAIETGAFESGVYIVKLSTDKGTVSRQVVK